MTHVIVSVVFKVYDFNNDGYLTKDEMLALLKGCLPPMYNTAGSDDDIDEGQKELCDIVIRKLVRIRVHVHLKVLRHNVGNVLHDLHRHIQVHED